MDDGLKLIVPPVIYSPEIMRLEKHHLLFHPVHSNRPQTQAVERAPQIPTTHRPPVGRSFAIGVVWYAVGPVYHTCTPLFSEAWTVWLVFTGMGLQSTIVADCFHRQ